MVPGSWGAAPRCQRGSPGAPVGCHWSPAPDDVWEQARVPECFRGLGALLLSILPHLVVSLGVCWGPCVPSYECAGVFSHPDPKHDPLLGQAAASWSLRSVHGARLSSARGAPWGAPSRHHLGGPTCAPVSPRGTDQNCTCLQSGSLKGSPRPPRGQVAGWLGTMWNH